MRAAAAAVTRGRTCAQTNRKPILKAPRRTGIRWLSTRGKIDRREWVEKHWYSRFVDEVSREKVGRVGGDRRGQDVVRAGIDSRERVGVYRGVSWLVVD